MKAVSTASVVSLVALASAFIAGADTAQACSIISTNAHYEHAMPNHVREARTIILARVLAVEPDIDGAVDDSVNRGLPMGDTHIYDFETVEILKGSWPDRFDLRGGPPFGTEPNQRCSEAVPVVCQVNDANEHYRNRNHELADQSRRDWQAFYTLGYSFRSGMGHAMRHPSLVEGGGDCRSFVASFEVDETFLIFFDGNGEAEVRQRSDPYRLNHHLITQPDDAWLEAVRHFIATQQSNTLPPQPFEELMAGFGEPSVIQPTECHFSGQQRFEAVAPEGVFLDDQNVIPLESWTALLPEAASNRLVAQCDGTQEFVAYSDFRDMLALPPFPIINGRVDFSHMPGPWTFTEGDQVPLHVVMSAADTDR